MDDALGGGICQSHREFLEDSRIQGSYVSIVVLVTHAQVFALEKTLAMK